MSIVALDLGCSTGVAVLDTAVGEAMTDTWSEMELDLRLAHLLRLFPAYGHTWIAERPLDASRGALARRLDAVVAEVTRAVPSVLWTYASAWKPARVMLLRRLGREFPGAYEQARTAHERDALLIAATGLPAVAGTRTSPVRL